LHPLRVQSGYKGEWWKQAGESKEAFGIVLIAGCNKTDKQTRGSDVEEATV